MEFASILNPVDTNAPQLDEFEQLWQLTYSILFMTLAGFVLNWIFSAVSYVYNSIRKKLTCSITLYSKEEIFKIVRHFLTEERYLKGSMTDIKA